MQLNTVVLPAPFGPISAVICPRCAAEGRVVDGDQPAEAHGQALDREQDRRRVRSARPPRLSGARIVLRSPQIPTARDSTTRPRGRQIIIATMATPKSSMRYWVEIAAESREDPDRCSRPGRGNATPIWRAHAAEHDDGQDQSRFDEGEAFRADEALRVAKNEPAKPPNMAPMAKAVSLVLVGLMPSERQAISSSRSASQARPIGSRRSRSVDPVGQQRQNEDHVVQRTTMRCDRREFEAEASAAKPLVVVR